MGRYSGGGRDLTEDCRSISTKWLKQNGYFDGFKAGTIRWFQREEETGSVGIEIDTDRSYMRLHYTKTSYWTGEKEDLDYRLWLASTPCHFGGKRYWFECPLSPYGRHCGKRVGVLYLSSGGKYFGCRHCYNLAYESQNKSGNRFYSAFGRFFDADEEAEKLMKSMKRWQYAGRPTKKALKLEKLSRQMGWAAQLVNRYSENSKSKKKRL